MFMERQKRELGKKVTTTDPESKKCRDLKYCSLHMNFFSPCMNGRGWGKQKANSVVNEETIESTCYRMFLLNLQKYMGKRGGYKQHEKEYVYTERRGGDELKEIV
jgi:hypothetical protein